MNKNLYINNNPGDVVLNESEFRITADQIQLTYEDGRVINVFDVDVTANKENDLDTGSMAADQWYHIYLVKGNEVSSGSQARVSIDQPVTSDENGVYFGVTVRNMNAPVSTSGLRTIVSLDAKKPAGIEDGEAYTYLTAFRTKFVSGEGINIEAIRQRGHRVFGKTRLEAELLNNKTNEYNPVDLTHIPPNAAVWHFRLKVDKNSVGTIDLEIRTEGDNYLINTRKIKIDDVLEIHQDYSIQITEPQRVYYKLTNGKDVQLQTIGWEF